MTEFAMHKLLPRAVVRAGCVPFEGGKWKSLSASYHFYQDRELTKRSRLNAMIQLSEDFDWIIATELGRNFKEDDWTLIVLEGWWLHETRVKSENLAILDCTFAFEPRVAEVAS